MEHIAFMQHAIAQAYEGVAQGWEPFGACVVREAQIVAAAHNQVHAIPDVTAHAEIRALRMACVQLQTTDLSHCILYTTCEPCPMCFSACHFAKIAMIVFACRIDDALRAGISQLEISSQTLQQLGHSAVQLVGDVLQTEALALFQAWQQTQGDVVD